MGMYIQKSYYTNLLSKTEKENKADHESLNSTCQLITGRYFEKQFQDCYTNTIFKLFQDKIRGMLFYNLTLVKEDGAKSIFHAIDVVERKMLRKRRVVYTICYDKVMPPGEHVALKQGSAAACCSGTGVDQANQCRYMASLEERRMPLEDWRHWCKLKTL
ncbi:hypothetical protein PIB30_058241 [Stylosanthes scabra]|uniref:Cystatin domain-containing protein n=1 Tax=Stylosanthes scabra TaxID=79078 RepID=A0ABU6VK64_9FABA|nr:hypothetical protein [Stylosanthes scabra]